MITAPTTTPRTHIDTLEDADINTLIAMRVFGHSQWCFGRFAPRAHSFENYCQECGAMSESSLAELLFADLATSHPRLIPTYSIENILELMKCQDRSTQACFVLYVRVAINADSSSIRAPHGEWLRLLNMMTPRLLGIAALQALEVIDEAGFVKTGQDREGGAL